MTKQTLLASASGTAVLSVLAGSTTAHPFGWRVNQDDMSNLQIEFLWDVTHKRWDDRAGFNGVVDDMLAFEEVLADRPADGIFALPDGVKIELVIDSFDAGVILRDPDDLGTALTQPGESWSVGTGGSGFITPAFWQIDPTADGFDAGKGVWEASFHIVDLSGQLGRSETYTYLLEPPPGVPAPAGAAALGIAGLAIARRRR